MRSRFTIILAILAIITGLLIYKADEWFIGATRAPDVAPLSVDSAVITGIDMDLAENQLSLRVIDRFWRVDSPFKDIANADQITELFTSIKDAAWLEIVHKADVSEATWTLTGLHKPAAHLRFMAGSELAAECWVGNPSAIEGAYYLSVPSLGDPSEREHYVVRSPLLTLLRKPTESWRDEQLLRVPAESVSQIIIDRGDGVIELSRPKPKAPWNVVRPLQTRGHNEHINDLLACLLNLKITSIGSPTTPSTAIAADTVRLSITTPAFPTPVVIDVHQPLDLTSGKTTATASHRSTSFEIVGEQLGQLWPKVNDLRDDRLAQVDPSKVQVIRILSAVTGEVVLKQEHDYWTLKNRDTWEPANGERVTKFFEALNTHPVREFVADTGSNLNEWGLDKPFLAIGWTIAAEPSLEPPVISTPDKGFTVLPEIATDVAIMFGEDKEGNIYAKYRDEPFVYLVGASILSAVPRDNVRWKALNPLRFTQFALTQIIITIGANPPTILDYDPFTAVWKGTRAGQDFTPQIDRVKADHIAGRLGNLVVDDWVQDRAEAAKALQDPAISIHVRLLSDPTNPKSDAVTRQLAIAPTVAGTDTALYYGRIDKDPDIFLLSRLSLQELLKSVLKDADKRR
jgi:Domain of unknown function (DUF4340)